MLHFDHRFCAPPAMIEPASPTQTWLMPMRDVSAVGLTRPQGPPARFRGSVPWWLGGRSNVPAEKWLSGRDFDSRNRVTYAHATLAAFGATAAARPIRPAYCSIGSGLPSR